MDSTKQEERVPLRMRYLAILASFLPLSILVTEQRLLSQREIICSFGGYIVGPYLSLIPLSYRLRFMIGSVCAALSFFLRFNTYLHAFSLGLIVSYFMLVANLFCAALCVRTKKKKVQIMSNVITGWLSFLTFFSFHFCPVITDFLCTPIFSLLFAAAGTVISYFYIIETPEEIFVRYRKAEKKSDAYEDLYKCISYINSADDSNIEEFRADYRSFLDAKTQIKQSYTLKEKITAIFLSVNVSFVYIAFQRAAGVENRYSLYRIFLGAMQLFTWSFKYASGSSSVYATIIPPVALYFVCVSTNNTQDILLVFIMLLGTGILPEVSSGYTLQPIDIACARSIQYICVLVVFLVLMLVSSA